MASSVNKAIILGRLGRDPELRIVPGRTGGAERSVCTFSVATDSGKGDDKRTDWHNVVTWGEQAKMCDQYLRKGRLVYIEGRMQTRKYKDKDGNDRQAFEIVASTVQFLDQPKADGGGEPLDGQLPF